MALFRRGWRLFLPLLLAPLILAVFEWTPLDRYLIGFYFDSTTHTFPLRDDQFMQVVMHSGLKLLVVAVGAAAFGGYLLSFILPQWQGLRRRLLWMFVGICGATSLVATLKYGSALHCPWDLAEYGGYAPFHGLLDRLPLGVSRGRCFPGGHASAGFSLMAIYFAWRDRAVLPARIALAAGLFLGMLMGWTQMMRGAHFLSHNVWSAWVVWTFLAAMYHLVPPGGSRKRVMHAAVPAEASVQPVR